MFNNNDNVATYGKIKVGMKTLGDATLALGSLTETNKNYGDKKVILKAFGMDATYIQKEAARIRSLLKEA